MKLDLDTPLFKLTVGEFLELMKQVQSPVLQPSKPMELMGLKGVKELTGYSTATIYAKTSNNEIPHYKRGTRLVFKREEILAWMLENKIQTTAEYCDMLDTNLLNRRKK